MYNFLQICLRQFIKVGVMMQRIRDLNTQAHLLLETLLMMSIITMLIVVLHSIDNQWIFFTTQWFSSLSNICAFTFDGHYSIVHVLSFMWVTIVYINMATWCALLHDKILNNLMHNYSQTCIFIVFDLPMMFWGIDMRPFVGISSLH